MHLSLQPSHPKPTHRPPKFREKPPFPYVSQIPPFPYDCPMNVIPTKNPVPADHCIGRAADVLTSTSAPGAPPQACFLQQQFGASRATADVGKSLIRGYRAVPEGDRDDESNIWGAGLNQSQLDAIHNASSVGDEGEPAVEVPCSKCDLDNDQHDVTYGSMGSFLS